MKLLTGWQKNSYYIDSLIRKLHNTNLPIIIAHDYDYIPSYGWRHISPNMWYSEIIKTNSFRDAVIQAERWALDNGYRFITEKTESML